MSKLDAVYRLYIRGYYSAEQALNVGKKKLSREEYTELENIISEEESKKFSEETEDVVEETGTETVPEVPEESEVEA